MEISQELGQIIESDLEKLKGIEVVYKNNGVVTGAIKKIKFSPLKITILKDSPKKRERPKHKVVFDHLIKLSLLYIDGTSKKFQ